MLSNHVLGVSNVSVEYMTKLLSDDRKPGVDKDGKVVPKVVPGCQPDRTSSVPSLTILLGYLMTSGLSKYI
jgi:hypothetical protein